MWKAEQIDTNGAMLLYRVTDDDDVWVANLKAEHAPLIVRAVNSHRELLEALEAMAEQFITADEIDFQRRGIGTNTPRGIAIAKARAAIERAKP